MISIETVKQLLKKENIPFTQTDFPSERDFWMAYAPHSDMTLAAEKPVSVLRIDGGQEKTPLYMDFNACQGCMALWDLNFGKYFFEIFECDEADVLPALVQEIRSVLAGKTHIIYAWSNRNHRWRGDACFHVSPGDEDDQSAAYEAALRKLQRWMRFPRIWGRKVTCAVYNWYSYQEFER